MVQGLSSINDWFSHLSQWNKIYGFTQNSDSPSNVVKSGNLKEQCKRFHEKKADIGQEELLHKIRRFASIL